MKHIVHQQEAGKLLRVLRGPMRLSWTAVKRAKWAQRILVNGEIAQVSRIVQPGDVVEFLERDSVPSPLAPCTLPIHPAYEDEYLAVVDKPAPLPVQCGKGARHDTLENAWFSYLGQPEGFVYRPVNRLDKGTSGLMVIAKSAHAQDLLQRQLHTDRFRREYLAVTEGIPQPPAGSIELPIAKEDAASVRRIVTPAGKACKTHYRVLLTAGSRSLVRLQLETGRTHQIRVHLSAIGCPVCGDFLYGKELDCLPGRFALHSAYLTLVHPFTGEELTLESPLPDALSALLQPAQLIPQPALSLQP